MKQHGRRILCDTLERKLYVFGWERSGRTKEKSRAPTPKIENEDGNFNSKHWKFCSGV